MKDYKKILEGVVNIINTTEKSDIGFANICTYIGENCPELKESEDEKIRKELIEQVVYIIPNDDEVDSEGNILPTHQKRINKYRAWLEKQGEQKAIEKFPKYKKGDILTDGKNKYEVLSWDYTETCIAAYYMKGVGCKFSWSCEEADKKLHLVEQKPADKVEPKFKVEEGKWYVCISQFCNCIEGRVYKATSDSRIMDDFGTEYDMHSDAYKYFRPWTIQDAKDGDVLVASDGSIFIFASVVDCSCKHHVALTIDGVVNINEGLKHYWETSKSAHPATKGQRDILVKAMANAGYTFDFEKKELKKIESEIEIPFGAKDSELQEVTYYIPKGFHAEIEGDNVVIKKGEQKSTWSEEDMKNVESIITDIKYCKKAYNNYSYHENEINWLKSLKERVQPKQEWSALDERNLQGVIDEIKANKNNAPDYDLETYDRFLNWLKSLRPHNTWKPSDEQINILFKYAEQNNKDGSILTSLYQDLKKLKG